MDTSIPKFSQDYISFISPSILIVDDEEIIRKALEITLIREGHRVVSASNGETAIEILQNESISLIICDLRLPGVSGVEVLAKARKFQPDAIRILLTGTSDLKSVLEAVNLAQVNQILLKPWENLVLSQMVSSNLEKYRLIKENQRLNELTFRQHEDLTLAHQNLKEELQLGARIHEILLIGQIPHLIPGIAIEAMTVPSKEIDGDFFEFYQPSEPILDIIIGDVMGKGIPAALVGTALKIQLLHYAVPFCHSKIFKKNGYWEEDLLSPEEIIANLHTALVPKLIYLEYFASLFYGRFHLQKRTFTFIDCGCTKPIHYLASENRAYFLSGNNLPLGTIEKDIYHPHQISYNQNDFFIFYSDGLTEAKSPEKKLYGPDRLIEIAEKNPAASPTELVKIIKSSVVAFAEGSVFDDDLTLIVLRINAVQTLQKAKMEAVQFNSNLSELDDIRKFISQLCLGAPGDALLLSELLQLAINEAFCNIVKHGYKNNIEGKIFVQGNVDDQGISIEIADQGQSFNPLAVQEPSLNGTRDNGYGWFLIREIADEVIYVEKKSQGGWNHMYISKKYINEGNKMQVTHNEQNNVLIITPLTENLDALAAPDFKLKVMQLIEVKERKNVVFDLHQLQFIDSSGLGSFLSVLRTLHGNGGDLKLACMNRPVRTMFELVSMHKVFEIFNSTDEAVKSF